MPDEDEELMSARLELTRLEVQFFDTAKAVDRLSKARKAAGIFFHYYLLAKLTQL